MKKGKILTIPLIRSVLRHSFPQKEESAFRYDGAVLHAQTTVVYGGEHAEALCFYRALNAALCEGMHPESLQLLLTLPESETETALDERMRKFECLAESENIRVSGGHTAFSDKVSSPVLSAVLSGEFGEIRADTAPNPVKTLFDLADSAGQSAPALLMIGTAGECGAGIYLQESREALAERFSADFLFGAEIREERLSVRKAAEILQAQDALLYPLSEGGLLSALYGFSEGYGTGFSADLLSVPIRQETVEICNFFDINPYELWSEGALLAAAADREAALSALRSSGIPAAVIGQLLPGKQKIILKKDEESFLERPKQDPVMRLSNFG